MEAAHEKYDRLIDRCKAIPPTPTAVAHPCDRVRCEGAIEAARLGLIAPILVGPPARIRPSQRSRARHLPASPSWTPPTATLRRRRRCELVRKARPRR